MWRSQWSRGVAVWAAWIGLCCGEARSGVVVGRGDESELLLRVSDPDPDWRMPPEGEPLSAEEIATLRAWIDGGLGWQAGFPFKRDVYVAPMALQEVTLPPPSREGREHPVDRIVDRYFADHGIEPPPPVGDEAFYRRVSQGMTPARFAHRCQAYRHLVAHDPRGETAANSQPESMLRDMMIEGVPGSGALDQSRAKADVMQLRGSR